MTIKKERALQALLTSRTRTEAARKIGISENTMRSYFADAEFAERYKAAFDDLFEDATREAQQTVTVALSTLRGLAEDSEQTPGVRVSASRSLLEYALKLTEQRELLSRIVALEEELRERVSK